MKDAKKDRLMRASDRLVRLIKKNFSEEEYNARQELQAFLREREKSKWEVRSNECKGNQTEHFAGAE